MVRRGVVARVKDLPRHHSAWLGDRAARKMERGEDVIILTGNELIAEPPRHVLEATSRALEEGYTGYPPGRGLYELREAISEKVKRDEGVVVDPETEIVVTLGAQEGVFLTIQALLDPGDEAIMCRPDYPFNYHIQVAGATPIYIPLYEEEGFRLDPEAFEAKITPRTRVLCFDSPHNPTGRVFTREEVEGMAGVAERHDLWVIWDSANEKLLWDGRKNVNMASLPGMKERTIITNSVSKSYGMGGWRVGYVAGPEELISHMAKLHVVVNNVGPTAFAQKGAVALYRGPDAPAPEVLTKCERARNLAHDRLNRIKGIRCHRPEGGGVMLPSISALGMSSLEAAQLLLDRANVALGPGLAYNAEGYLRMNFTSPRLGEALQRIAAALGDA